VAAGTLVSYLLLVNIVRQGSNTIRRQEEELVQKIEMLTGLLAQNSELHERVRQAASRNTETTERLLRRISSDLHDGPAQDLGLALLRLDHVMAGRAEVSPAESGAGEHDYQEDLDVIQDSLTRAVQEVRAISTGLRLPELEGLEPQGVVERVVRTHERKTGTRVALRVSDLPKQVDFPVKIALYRLIQEGLTNAFRHGGGVGQNVRAWGEKLQLRIEVSDRGPGFAWTGALPAADGHLGLIGMRERVESLGGLFSVESVVGLGTTIKAWLPLHGGTLVDGPESMADGC
jgi:signal transduction histidine kinase